jgi:predicted transcriptional regulator
MTGVIQEKGFVEVGLDSEEEDFTILPPHMLIAEYLNIVKSCERETLKFELMTLCKHLSKNNIIVPIDFQPYGTTLYSEIFDRDIMFLSSAGVICEKHSSIKYEITERGKKLLEDRDGCYKNVPPNAIKALDKVLSSVGRRTKER